MAFLKGIVLNLYFSILPNIPKEYHIFSQIMVFNNCSDFQIEKGKEDSPKKRDFIRIDSKEFTSKKSLYEIM